MRRSQSHTSPAFPVKIGFPVPVVVITHTTRDQVIRNALDELEKAKLLNGPAVRIRIEE